MPTTQVVHLIHGTWPHGLIAHRLRFLRKGPIWVEAGSKVRDDLEALAGADARFEQFAWSGNNSFKGRADAARALVTYLRSATAAEPAASHLLVAHSHGGTVAVEALQRDPGLAAAGVDGMLTLATPFVSMHAAASSRWEREAMGMIARYAPYLVIAIAISAWASLTHVAELSYLAAFSRLLALLVFAMIVFSSMNLLPWFPMPGSRFSRQLLDATLPPLDPAFPLFAIRAPRDEASLSIAAAQVVGMLSDLAWRLLIHKPVAWLRKWPIGVLLILVVLYSVYAWVGWCETAMQTSLERIVSTALYASVLMLATYTVPVLLAFVILLPASAALALAAGIEVMAMPGLLTVDAEPLPAGSATRELLILDLSDAEREQLSMRHSIYELERARQEVGAWFGRMKARRATAGVIPALPTLIA